MQTKYDTAKITEQKLYLENNSNLQFVKKKL